MAGDGAAACAPLCFTYEGCLKGQMQTGVNIKGGREGGIETGLRAFTG